MTVETLHSDFSNLRAEFADLRDQVSHSMSQFENYADRQADAAASREAMLAYKDHLKFSEGAWKRIDKIELRLAESQSGRSNSE
ncbi:hypothetical protein HKD42_01735 [Altererythrobacter sp. RZ02]|uniref:Uncharacterized protein n=1 Tax=Pontixanthobacter rizhaonensis TaxID=2730337 RepID=A0A848QJ46_9SPHN|nr:hypothetical protein [Pontixanthobacter rizhaonensis]NMW30779.1 hypothetical protein [Pontixanthobacter rizhaonensis]